MFSLTKKGFEKENIVPYGNMFLIGNGHLGYRGTLEEFKKKEIVGLNIIGFYDRYKDKWRESLNAPNPFFVHVKSKDTSFSVLDLKPIQHTQSLDLKRAIFKRYTEFDNLTIRSERFVSQVEENVLCMKYQIICKVDLDLEISIGLDTDVYEINGPHYKSKKVQWNNKKVEFVGITNEDKILHMKTCYSFPRHLTYTNENGIYKVDLRAKKYKIYTLYAIAKLSENEAFTSNIDITEKLYSMYKEAHCKAFMSLWEYSDIVIVGNKEAQFNMRYSIYHLLILGNKNYKTSIPARGLSGQTYKGAVFWDTEIFLLPFFSYTNPSIARSFLEYRIRTLFGAKVKAEEYGYEGAFYAWESQETGLEACSKYNVTDPITNEPIRTYFNEKQIHLSADIIYALEEYIQITGDESILLDGGLEMAFEVTKFFISFAKKIDGKFHILDVIGPDEYHECVNDNAFTNYMAKYAIEIYIKYAKKLSLFDSLLEKSEYFINHLYLPKPNQNKLIEQFTGYFDLEDTTVDIVRSRLRVPNEYWGTENGVAYPTRIIKQADVITLLCLLNKEFDKETIKANYEFYYPYTEHGSSLSASMYSIIGFQIGRKKEAFEMFMKSAGIDLSTNQKLYAGGIYIGGTHPASSGGAYMSLIYGMAGLKIIEDKPVLQPHLAKGILSIRFKIKIKEKGYYIKVYKDNSYVVEVLK
ncbi:MAG: hypothetical protein NC087_04880 [Anaeroplasma bactoclasticum]|nr:hypothetical protein [Anaeroplasma bactoclasticum]